MLGQEWEEGQPGLSSDAGGDPVRGGVCPAAKQLSQITEQPELEGTYKEHQSPVLWLLGRQAKRGT